MILRQLLRRRLDEGLIYPDYRRWSILNLGRAARSEKVPDIFELGENYLVFIVDGLGYYMFRRFFGEADGVYPISSVLPTNTAVALPAMYSGEIPAKHGYFGPFSKINGKVVDLFREGVDLPAVLQGTHVLPAHLREKRPLIPLEGKRTYYANGFDLKHVLERIRGSAIVYVHEVDAVAHERGPYAPPVKETVAFYLDVLRRVAERWGRVLLISDHGMRKTGRQVKLTGTAFGDFRAVLTDNVDEKMNAFSLFPDLSARLYGVEDPPAKYVVLPSDGTTYYFPGTERLMDKTRGGMHGGATPEEVLALLIPGSGREVAELLNKVLKASGG